MDFASEVLEIITTGLPVNGDDVNPDVASNTDMGIFTAAFEAPLIHGRGHISTLDAEGEPRSDLYRLYIEYKLTADRRGEFLTVQYSKYEIRVHTQPAIRFEYERQKSSTPAAHVHFSGIGGLLSPALMKNGKTSRTDKRKDGNVSALHIPVGGHRFRPSIEDFLYFVIQECGFRGRTGWEPALKASREKWFDIQLQAAIRDNPAVAAQTLSDQGFTVEPPAEGCPPSRRHESW